jgi:proline-specific peptidase
MSAALSHMTTPGGERWVAVPGGRVWVSTVGGGGGLTLLVLHGGPGSSHDYLVSLEALGGERPVIFYDQLGCGRSERPADPSLWRIDRYVQELQAVVGALGLERFHLLGHSWGTMLALDWALEHRGPAASLTFVSPCFSMRRIKADMAHLKEGLPRAVQDVLTTHEARGTTSSGIYRASTRLFYQRHVCRLQEWPEPLVRSQELFAWDVYRTMWGPSEFTITGNLSEYEREDQLGALEAPVLYVCGRHDEITPESTTAYHERTPGSRIEIFPASSHVPNLEEPALFHDVLASFLRGVES